MTPTDITLLASAGAALAVLTSLAGFAMVLVGVVGLFGHAGRTAVSPQRRIALATGAADRRTVFEWDLLAPVMWLLLRLTEKLSLGTARQRLRATLMAAGSPNFYTAEEYLALSLLWGLVAAAALGGLHLLALGSLSLPAAGGGFVAGVAAPLYLLHDAARRRVRRIGRHVPYSLDLIALAMGAGSTFTEAIRTVVREAPDDPLNVELATVLAEMDLGTTRRQALANLAERVPLESLRSIVASIIQAEDLGTPMADVLKGQSQLLRRHRSARAEKLAAAAGVRILLPSVIILLSVVLTVFAPIIIRAVRGELF
jgi:tight adherence protein C